jgi:hypothetical protein
MKHGFIAFNLILFLVSLPLHADQTQRNLLIDFGIGVAGNRLSISYELLHPRHDIKKNIENICERYESLTSGDFSPRSYDSAGIFVGTVDSQFDVAGKLIDLSLVEGEFIERDHNPFSTPLAPFDSADHCSQSIWSKATDYL